MKYSELISRLLSLVVIAAISTTTSDCSAQTINWYPDIASASEAAAEQNKLVMLHFEAGWCRPCENLKMFVYTDSAVQRVFDKNVIAVKVDADSELELVKQYGVSSLPFDIALSPAGQVISKRKSPTDATAYTKMVEDYSKAIVALDRGNVQVKQNLQERERTLKGLGQKPKFEGQATSFTPEFPYQQAHSPSRHSMELKRTGQQIISNPFMEKKPAEVANAYQPHAAKSGSGSQSVAGAGAASLRPTMKLPAPLKRPQEQKIVNQHFLNIPGKIVPPPAVKLVQGEELKMGDTPTAFASNDFRPKNFAPKPFQPTNALPPNVAPDQVIPDFKFDPPAAFKSAAVTQKSTPSADVQQFQSSVQTESITEAEVVKHSEEEAKPKVVMNDHFFGKASTVESGVAEAGMYQAKITLAKDREPDFVPSAPQPTGGNSAQIVTQDSPKKFGVKAVAGQSNVLPEEGEIEDGSAIASKTPAKPKYALHGKCPVTLLSEAKWVDGDTAIGCVHRNRIYLFTSNENFLKFKSDPDAYSPVLAGYDPVVFSETGRLIDGLEEFGVFMGKVPNQRIVLFASPETRARFQMEPHQFLETVRQAMKSSGGGSSALIR